MKTVYPPPLKVRDVIRVACAVSGVSEPTLMDRPDGDSPMLRHFVAFVALVNGCHPMVVGKVFDWSDDGVRRVKGFVEACLDRDHLAAEHAELLNTIHLFVVRLKAARKREAWMENWRAAQTTTPRVYGRYRKPAHVDCEGGPRGEPPARDWAREPMQAAG